MVGLTLHLLSCLLILWCEDEEKLRILLGELLCEME